MENLTTDLCFLVANYLPQYKVLREVNKTWHETLDSEKYFAVRTAARTRVHAYELPEHQVLARIPQYQIRFDLNRPGLTISDDGIRKFQQYITWSHLPRRQKLSNHILSEFTRLIDFNSLLYNIEMSENTIDLFKDSITRSKLIKRVPNLPREFVSYYIHLGNAEAATQWQVLDEELIEQHITDLNYSAVCKFQRLSEPFMRKHAAWVDWGNISKYQSLSEDFMDEFSANLYWASISKHQFLSVGFILKHKNKIIWSKIFEYQKLSIDDIEQIIHQIQPNEIYWRIICTYQIISENFIRKHENTISWCAVSEYQELSVEFLREFKDSVRWNYIPSNRKIKLTQTEKIEFLHYVWPQDTK